MVIVEYQGHKIMTMANRQEICEKNMPSLLDFYENCLELKDRRRSE